jgi:hypothetical protein
MLTYVLGGVALAGWLTAAYLGMIVCELEDSEAMRRGLSLRRFLPRPERRCSHTDDGSECAECFDARQY